VDVYHLVTLMRLEATWSTVSGETFIDEFLSHMLYVQIFKDLLCYLTIAPAKVIEENNLVVHSAVEMLVRFFCSLSSTAAIYNGILDDKTYKGGPSREDNDDVSSKPPFEDWLRPSATLAKGLCSLFLIPDSRVVIVHSLDFNYTPFL
jgi:hypothetical protein